MPHEHPFRIEEIDSVIPTIRNQDVVMTISTDSSRSLELTPFSPLRSKAEEEFPLKTSGVKYV